MNLINDLEELALASRLKRLGERLSQDVNKIYKESDLDFEAKWFPILEVLRREKILGIIEIAEALEMSHPAITQFVDQLLKKKLIRVSADKNDGRRRMVSLSPAGKKLLDQLTPILNVIKEENRKWIDEATADILKTLSELEMKLDEKGMYQRIKKRLLELPQTDRTIAR